MPPTDTIARVYEDLANHCARQGESRQRDNCLVLAADAALSAGLPEEADRLRKRLLLTNPNHLLRPYLSMAEAMESSDVRAYVAELRKQLPPESAARMLNRNAETYTMDNPVARPKPAAPKAKLAPVAEEVSGLAYALSLLMLGLGLTLAGGVLFVVFVAPFLDY